MSLKSIYYKDIILKMRRSVYYGRIINAKPCLLLTVVSLIDKGNYTANRIIFDDDLNLQYQQIWSENLKGQTATPINNPYYFLSSEEFWHLKWKGKEIHTKSPSSKFIRDNIEYAYLDEDLWELLQNEKERETLKNQLIKMIQENQ